MKFHRSFYDTESYQKTSQVIKNIGSYQDHRKHRCLSACMIIQPNMAHQVCMHFPLNRKLASTKQTLQQSTEILTNEILKHRVLKSVSVKTNAIQRNNKYHFKMYMTHPDCISYNTLQSIKKDREVGKMS